MKICEIGEIMNIKNLYKTLQTDLEAQYRGWKTVFWIDITLATLLALTGVSQLALAVMLMGLVAGVLSNNKLTLMNQKAVLTNQQLVLDNQLRIEDKVEVMLEMLQGCSDSKPKLPRMNRGTNK